MGKADAYQSDYLDDNFRFADQINGALFQERQVVKPEELEPVETQMFYLGKESAARREVQAVADKARMWKGRLFHILAVENQTYVDYRMVLRNMLTESLSYYKQWKQKKRMHEREGDLGSNQDAFLSGIGRDERFIPVITLVVYCGTEHPWDGARCLHDLLDIDDETKEYVTNYKINLYDCHEHDTFDEYHTGLRQLFEMVRYAKDKEQLGRVIEENRDHYRCMDSDTRELVEVVAGIKIPEEYEEKGAGAMENGVKRYNVCKAWEDQRLDGIEEGRKEGRKEGREEGMRQYLVKLVCKKLQKNKSAVVIAEELEEDLSEVEKVLEAQRKVGSYDIVQICKAMG